MVKESVFQVLKSVLASIVFSLVFVLAFTLVIQLASLPVTVIRPVNQVFKVLAIAVGNLIFIRGEKGFVKGAVSGFIAVILSYLLFSAIGGEFNIGWTFALEIVLGIFAGLISGIIAVNLKKS